MKFGKTMEKSTYFLMTLFSLALGSLQADTQVTHQNELASAQKQPKDLNLSKQENRIEVLEKQMNEVYTDTVRDTFGAKAPSARPQLDSYHLYVSADALYWKAFEGGTDYAYETASTSTPLVGKSSWLDFQWSWGFRTELGYRTSHDDWNLALHYTWFYDKADSEITAPPGGQVLPLFFLFKNSTPFSLAKGNLRLHLNDSDISLQKSFFLSPHFSLSPIAGLRSVWIDQKISQYAIGPTTVVDLSGKNEFWGIGPLLGIAPRWFIDKHWNLFATFTGSIFYGEFDVATYVLQNAKVYEDLKDKLHQIVPTVRGVLGFGWEINSFCDHYHFALNVAYEGQYWWRQNQWFSYRSQADSTDILNRLGEDLGFHGLTINALFDF